MIDRLAVLVACIDKYSQEMFLQKFHVEPKVFRDDDFLTEDKLIAGLQDSHLSTEEFYTLSKMYTLHTSVIKWVARKTIKY